VLAVDFLGHGQSSLGLSSDSYKLGEVVNTLEDLIRIFPHRQYTLICHSYGCIQGVSLANLSLPIAALVLIAPKADVTSRLVKQARILRWIPSFVLDIFRFFDKLGGVQSKSVCRMVASDAPDHIKRLQLAYNGATPSSVIRSMVLGMQLFGEKQYQAIKHMPVLLVCFALLTVDGRST
jgi:pimeloyl-ACP methyl ester carboxylesterase